MPAAAAAIKKIPFLCFDCNHEAQVNYCTARGSANNSWHVLLTSVKYVYAQQAILQESESMPLTGSACIDL